jgi:hypothetical protein
MAYQSPAFEDFVERYPEFEDSVEPDRFDTLLPVAEREVNDTWIDQDRVPALLALIAHWLSVEGALTGSSGLSGGTVAGPIVSETVGPLSVTYKGYGSGGGRAGGTSASIELDATPYGVLYDTLRTRSFPPVLVI